MSDQLPVIRLRDPSGLWGVYLGTSEGERRLGSYLDADGFVPSPQRPDLRPERASRHIHDPVERWAVVQQAIEAQRPALLVLVPATRERIPERALPGRIAALAVGESLTWLPADRERVRVERTERARYEVRQDRGAARISAACDTAENVCRFLRLEG